ncbi:hypothetical protein HAX54_034778 [Datura stramonium]|uniref:Uncharacterized protein n=1 Tax=Datura stramonium TaxID=4076 RepID=A0ABS8SEI6_DATST|nr:hypothetical protein [Datura stramonium]
MHESLKKDSAGNSPLGGSFPKEGQEGKCMLDLKQGSSPIAEKEMKKSDDDKQLSINGRVKQKGLKKDGLGDVDADVKGGTSADCNIKSYPGNEEKEDI